MSTFYAILTTIGEAKIAHAHALGETVQITHMAVGDGNGNPTTPDSGQTALVNERRRAPLNTLSIDPQNASQIIAEQVIPEDIGGWWIREIGLFDADGDLVAVANCPDTYKPVLAEGSGRTQVIRMVLIVSSASAVQLKIDPAIVLATRAYVDGLTVRASQAEAEAGTENSKIMTPLRVLQAIRSTGASATETLRGVLRVAMQAETDAGTVDDRVVTPKKLRWGFSINLSSNGYIVLPTWLGGLIIQWGNPIATTSGIAITFPIAFPNAALAISAMDFGVASSRYVQSFNNLTQTGFTVYGGNDTDVFSYIAIGY